MTDKDHELNALKFVVVRNIYLPIFKKNIKSHKRTRRNFPLRENFWMQA